MTDELINETGTTAVDNTEDYLAAIKELKQNSVSRDEYEKLKADNKRLINSVVNGQLVDETPVVVCKTDAEIAQMRRELFDPDKSYSNLDFVSRIVDLRDALIERGEPDPFVPVSHKYSPTEEDTRIAEKCATVYKECIEAAQGDSEYFTNELMRRTKDIIIPGVKRR